MSEWKITLDINALDGSGPYKRRWCIIHTQVGTKGDKPLVVIGINPSGGTHTDENEDPVFSPTARKLHKIAEESKKHGEHKAFNRLVLFNITPVATPSVKVLKDIPESVISNEHAGNLDVISKIMEAYGIKGAPVLLCFGNAVRKVAGGKCLKLLPEILKRIDTPEADTYCLGDLTGKKCPRHPLYCRETEFSSVKYENETFIVKKP